MSKKQCIISVEDRDAVTVRKGRHLSDVLAEVLAAHLGRPLLVLAVVAGDVLVQANDMDEGFADELALRDAFTRAADAYSKAVTDRWDREAEEKEAAEQATHVDGDMHAGCCECGDCVEPAEDDRDRLLAEELRASTKVWPPVGLPNAGKGSES